MSSPKVLPASTREEVEHTLNYQFTSRDLLWEALQASGNGVRVIGQRKVPDGNKRLAMLGDAVLQLVVLGQWYASGEKRQVGSQVVQRLCCNQNLDSLGRILRLDYFINPNLVQRGIVYPATMTATVEALIGATYLDGGLDAATNLARHWGLCSGMEERCGPGISVSPSKKASATGTNTTILCKRPNHSTDDVCIAVSDTNSDDGRPAEMHLEQRASCKDPYTSESSLSELIQGKNQDEETILDGGGFSNDITDVNGEEDTESQDSSQSLTLGISDAEEDDDLEEGPLTLPQDADYDEDDDEEDGGVKLSGGELRALSKEGRRLDSECKEAGKSGFMMWL